MYDLDQALAQLAAEPPPGVIDELEERVLTRIGSRPASRGSGLLGIGLATIVAVAIGMVGSEIPPAARPIGSAVSLGEMSPLAPSVLLVGEQ